jgi:hypothetical protein
VQCSGLRSNEIGVLDPETGPEEVERLVLADHALATLDQREQHIQRRVHCKGIVLGNVVTLGTHSWRGCF